MIGDTAAVTDAAGRVPGMAPAAKQMGRYVGRLIAARIAGKPAPRRSATGIPAISPPSAAGPRW